MARRGLGPFVLDPLYSGKGLAGLIALIAEGRWTPDQNVIFLHTVSAPRPLRLSRRAEADIAALHTTAVRFSKPAPSMKICIKIRPGGTRAPKIAMVLALPH